MLLVDKSQSAQGEKLFCRYFSSCNWSTNYRREKDKFLVAAIIWFWFLSIEIIERVFLSVVTINSDKRCSIQLPSAPHCWQKADRLYSCAGMLLSSAVIYNIGKLFLMKLGAELFSYITTINRCETKKLAWQPDRKMQSYLTPDRTLNSSSKFSARCQPSVTMTLGSIQKCFHSRRL